MRACLRAPCPLCKKEIEYTYQTENIPFFSEILIISARCDCGFRHSDTMVLAESAPVRWTFRIRGEEDLTVRIVRGSTGSIELPELGIRVDPGPACEGSVTNVEGVLNEIAGVLEGLVETGEGAARMRAEELLRQLDCVKAGSLEITLVLRDPKGNSGIVSSRAEKAILSEEELG